MALDRFIIAPFDNNSGLENDLRPWLIPDQAFSELTNAYVFRGRVRKRFGSRWFGDTALSSRLRFTVGTTTGGVLSGNVRTIAADAGMPTVVGQAFSVLSTVFTVFNSTAGVQQMKRSDGSAATATYNLTTSDFNITATGAPDGTPVYFYLAEPVMGLLTYDNNSLQQEFIIGFDQRYAYQYITNTGWERLAGETNAGDAVWTGDDSQFFWADTYSGVNASDRLFFVTNFNEAEPNFMRYYFDTTGLWTTFDPVIDASANVVYAARIVVNFKNRLLLFNTWEGTAGSGSNYINRCRYSAIGDPTATDAWRQDIPGQGNAIDAATIEAIVTVEFVKDRLIVFFEQSTWELVYTGNQAYPFVWQQINTELGAESPFSIVPFDKVAIGVGNIGIMACNGSNVERIDNKIPDEVFEVHNTDDGIFRVYGIRDYRVEMIYWTFPNTEATSTFPFPNRVLVYNYKTGTWAINEDTITVFGYYQPQTGITWDSLTVTWDDDVSWDSGAAQSFFRQVVGGNQEGYTFICDADEPTNALVIQITNLVPSGNANNFIRITAINHNFQEGDYVYLNGITATIADPGNLTMLNNKIFQVINSAANPITANAFTVIYNDALSTIITGTYAGAGLISRVSNIVIQTKEYNFYAKEGRNAYVSRIDFMVDKTAAGQMQVDFFVSTATDPLLEESAINGVLLGSGTLDTFPYTAANGAASPIPFEANAVRLWHPVYFQADGEVVQLQLNMNDAQMRNTAIRSSGFELHAMIIYAQKTANRLQ